MLLSLETGGIVLIVVGALVLLLGVMFIAYYNSFVKLTNNAKEAYSTMDIYLKKRYDLIPNIVETVKGFAKHEEETLNGIVNARNKAISATSTSEAIAENCKLENGVKGLFALAEQYPELKSNQNFLDLQNSLRLIEKDIENARRYYNANVKALNTSIEKFPANIFAGLYKVEKMSLYEISNEEERNNVKVKFD